MGTQARPRGSARRWALRAPAVLVALLLVGELGLRVTGTRMRFPTACDWDPRMGCVLRPHVSDDFTVGIPFHFTTNSQGRRDPERGPKAAGARRVLVLGDSVAFGVPVADDETFAARLERRLAGERIEVINAGSPYLRGTEQQLSYFIDRGAALQPDLVLLEFTAQNDFADNAHHYFWRVTASGLERVDGARPATFHHRVVLASLSLPPVAWLDRHSWLFDAFELTSWHIMHLPPAGTREEWVPTTEAVIARLEDEARRAGARLALVMMPSPGYLAAARRRDPPPPYSDETELLDLAARRHLPLLDLTAPVVSAQVGPRLDCEDGHLSKPGHDAVAALLAERMREWLPPAK